MRSNWCRTRHSSIVVFVARTAYWCMYTGRVSLTGGFDGGLVRGTTGQCTRNATTTDDGEIISSVSPALSSSARCAIMTNPNTRVYDTSNCQAAAVGSTCSVKVRKRGRKHALCLTRRTAALSWEDTAASHCVWVLCVKGRLVGRMAKNPSSG